MAYSEAQKRATQNWAKKNKEKTAYIKAKSAAKSFIMNKATSEDLEQVKRWIQERMENA